MTTKRFTGQYHEASLPGGEGLSYYGARWYDAKLGRFLSADTVVPGPGNPQAFNRYSYVLNRPTGLVDPTGHDPCDNGSRTCDSLNAGSQTFPTWDWNNGIASFYSVWGYGLFDTDHIVEGIGKAQSVYQQIKQDNTNGGATIFMRAGLKQSPYAKKSSYVEAWYKVSGNLTLSQMQSVTLGILEHWEHQVEPRQSFGTVYSIEDLPSDYLGYYVGLHPGTTWQQALMDLGSGSIVQPIDIVDGYVYKLSMPQNYEFRPAGSGGEHPKDWPPQFQMTVSGQESGLWSVLSVNVVEPEHTTIETVFDWVVNAATILTGHH